MRKGIVWGAATLICALAAVGAATVASVRPAPASPQAAATTAAAAEYRVLGVWEGKLAVFLPQEDTPERVYDVWVSTLPAEEQSRLRAGIAVRSKAELSALLEDYTA